MISVWSLWTGNGLNRGEGRRGIETFSSGSPVSEASPRCQESWAFEFPVFSSAILSDQLGNAKNAGRASGAAAAARSFRFAPLTLIDRFLLPMSPLASLTLANGRYVKNMLRSCGGIPSPVISRGERRRNSAWFVKVHFSSPPASAPPPSRKFVIKIEEFC